MFADGRQRTPGKEPLLAGNSPPKSSPNFSVRPRSSVGIVTVDLIRRSWVRFPGRGFDSHRGQKNFSLPRVVPWFPLLGVTPSGLITDSFSTLIYTSEYVNSLSPPLVLIVLRGTTFICTPFFSKDRLNWGKYEILKIWWIWKIEIWCEELEDGYQTVPYQPGALIWGGQLSVSVSNLF